MIGIDVNSTGAPKKTVGVNACSARGRFFFSQSKKNKRHSRCTQSSSRAPRGGKWRPFCKKRSTTGSCCRLVVEGVTGSIITFSRTGKWTFGASSKRRRKRRPSIDPNFCGLRYTSTPIPRSSCAERRLTTKPKIWNWAFTVADSPLRRAGTWRRRAVAASPLRPVPNKLLLVHHHPARYTRIVQKG